MGKIVFPGGGKWVAVSQRAAAAFGANSQPMDSDGGTLSSDLRMWMLALGRMDDNGHAHFEPTHRRKGEGEQPGELRRLLGRVDLNGELKPMSSRNVYKIKERLANAGALVDASGGEICMWVACDMATRDASYKICPFHLHSRYGYGNPLTQPSALSA